MSSPSSQFNDQSDKRLRCWLPLRAAWHWAREMEHRKWSDCCKLTVTNPDRGRIVIYKFAALFYSFIAIKVLKPFSCKSNFLSFICSSRDKQSCLLTEFTTRVAAPLTSELIKQKYVRICIHKLVKTQPIGFIFLYCFSRIIHTQTRGQKGFTLIKHFQWLNLWRASLRSIQYKWI